MIDFEFELMQQNPEWCDVLAAYRAEQLRLKQDNPEGEFWVDRLREVDPVKTEWLPRIHGKLIALGMLRFEIADRANGVRYQVSSAGVQLLNRLANSVDAEAPELDDTPELEELAQSA